MNDRRKLAAWILGGVAVVALIGTILLTLSGGSEFGSPSVEGEALPGFDSNAPDGAVGQGIPTVTGADWGGDTVEISSDGRPKIILFLAHWCPHCQREVPLVQGWLDAGGLPDGVDFLSVATGIRPTADNFPPSDWLERESWSAPVLVDDEGNSVATAYGLSAFPFWVFVAPDGTVAGRTSGGIPIDGLQQLAESLLTIES